MERENGQVSEHKQIKPAFPLKGNKDSYPEICFFYRVFDQLMCSEPELDSHRLMDIINDCITTGMIEDTISIASFEETNFF